MKGMGVDQSVIAALRKAKFVEGARQAEVSLQEDGTADPGRARQGFASAAAVSEGVYGMPCIVHSLPGNARLRQRVARR